MSQQLFFDNGDLNLADIRNLDFSPTQIRQVREYLGLSRADIEDHTGLGSSVVWRAEQPTRKITGDQYALIHGFLANAAQHGKPECCGKKSGKKTQSSTVSADTAKLQVERDAALTELAEVQKALEMGMQGATELHKVLVATRTALETEITAAKTKKASTAALKRVLDVLNCVEIS